MMKQDESDGLLEPVDSDDSDEDKLQTATSLSRGRQPHFIVSDEDELQTAYNAFEQRKAATFHYHATTSSST
jgi:hypothetical protein